MQAVSILDRHGETASVFVRTLRLTYLPHVVYDRGSQSHRSAHTVRWCSQTDPLVGSGAERQRYCLAACCGAVKRHKNAGRSVHQLPGWAARGIWACR